MVFPLGRNLYKAIFWTVLYRTWKHGIAHRWKRSEFIPPSGYLQLDLTGYPVQASLVFVSSVFPKTKRFDGEDFSKLNLTIRKDDCLKPSKNSNFSWMAVKFRNMLAAGLVSAATIPVMCWLVYHDSLSLILFVMDLFLLTDKLL